MAAFITVLVILGVLWLLVHNSNQKQAREQAAKEAHNTEGLRLHTEYLEALGGTNRAKALIAGRTYYGFVRQGPLTLYDEQAITNDMSTMK